MQCPVDGNTLVISDKQGVEIDYCPQCRGVWLDRGELDKLIDRMSSMGSGAYPQQSQPHVQPQQYDNRQQPERRHDDDDDDDHHKDSYSSHDGHHKKKKEGFLGDLFDF